MYEIKYRECFDGFSVGRVERDQDFTDDLGYFRNEYEIHYIFQGERYYLNSGSCYQMQAGGLALVDKAKIASTCIIGGKYHDRLMIQLESKTFLPLCSLLGIDMEQRFRDYSGVYQIGKSGSLLSYIGKLEKLMEDRGIPEREARMRWLILGMVMDFDQLPPYRMDGFSPDSLRGALEKQKRIGQVTDYIAEHYMEALTLEELSQLFFMSKSYLSRIFREVTNFTVSEYINLLKIGASREYLLKENLSVREISEMLGFHSLTYFERIFKREMAVTPLQFRQMNRDAR